MKRLFDIAASLIGLVLLAPLFAAVSVIIKIDSPGPVFFRQERMGKDFRPFGIYKFRTMDSGADRQGPSVTVRGDRRVSRVGKFLRKYKIDELPQLLNVLRGEMSLVGPRPEVRKYVELFRDDYSKLLSVRPGITDPASIYYSEEELVLSAADDWENAYITKVLPEKIRLSRGYVEGQTALTDVSLIFRTILKAASSK